MNNSQDTRSPTVLITGFGPFRSLQINPSWQVAKALQTYLDWPQPVNIILKQIEVTYNAVSKKIPDYWNRFHPKLVVHLGVAPGIEEIRLERSACNTDYCHQDNNGLLPEARRCVKSEAPSMLSTFLPLEDVCRRLQSQTTLPVTISTDAGRYLCEYIYYQSLFIDASRTVFIHIPELKETFTLENVAQTIQLIIYELLRCLNSQPATSNDATRLPSKSSLFGRALESTKNNGSPDSFNH